MGKPDGGPAFPAGHPVDGDGNIRWGYEGMTLRDWFAGQALAGILANPTIPGDQGEHWWPEFARWAGMAADAMIAERSREESE